MYVYILMYNIFSYIYSMHFMVNNTQYYSLCARKD